MARLARKTKVPMPALLSWSLFNSANSSEVTVSRNETLRITGTEVLEQTGTRPVITGELKTRLFIVEGSLTLVDLVLKGKPSSQVQRDEYLYFQEVSCCV